MVDLSANPIIVDATSVPVSGMYNVNTVRWVIPSGATVGMEAKITDLNGRLLFHSVATNAGSFVDSVRINVQWNNGFVATSLPAGVLYIYTDIVPFASAPSI